MQCARLEYSLTMNKLKFSLKSKCLRCLSKWTSLRATMTQPKVLCFRNSKNMYLYNYSQRQSTSMLENKLILYHIAGMTRRRNAQNYSANALQRINYCISSWIRAHALLKLKSMLSWGKTMTLSSCMKEETKSKLKLW